MFADERKRTRIDKRVFRSAISLCEKYPLNVVFLFSKSDLFFYDVNLNCIKDKAQT